MKTRTSLTSMLRSDRTLAALVFLFGACVGGLFLYAHTEVFKYPFGMERQIFTGAAMVAGGRGFVFPPAQTIPGWDDFLTRQVESYDTRRLPATVNTSFDDSVGAYHRYLVYALGLTWRIFGITWPSVKYLAAVLFGAAVAIGYGVLRLGMNRFLSVLGALVFMISPAMLVAVSDIRDFSKAPFMLGAVLIMGVLAKGPVTARKYWGLAAALGGVIGVGMGFRQDLLICLPPAMLVVGLLASGRPRLSILRRLVAVALLVACFGATGWPMLIRMGSGGAQPYHPIVQGFSSEMRDNLGLQMAGYEPISLFQDNYVFSTLCSYNARVNGGLERMTYNSPLAVRTGKQWILETARTFPADILTRGYAAVFWALGDGGAQTDPNAEAQTDPWIGRAFRLAKPLSVHMYYYGIFYLVLALAIVSARSLRGSVLLLFFLLYFCGYVSLEFQYRHAFHLCLVPVWILGFLLGALFHGVSALVRAPSRAGIAAVLFHPRRWWSPPAKRVLAFCIGAAIVLFAPLGAARIYQHVTVGNLLQRCAAAPLSRVETVQEPLGDWVVFRPKDRGESLMRNGVFAREMIFHVAAWRLARGIAITPVGADVLCTYMNATAIGSELLRPRHWDTRTGYLVAELEASSKERLLLLKYESQFPRSDFSQVVTVASARDGAGTVKYFFPAYEVNIPEELYGWQPFWNHFVGVALPQEHAADLKGLYRVEDAGSFRLLLNVSLPEDWTLFRRYQSIARHRDSVHRYARGDRPWGWADRAAAKAAAGEKDEALMLYRAALALNPRNAVSQFHAGELFADRGDTDAAAHAFETAICLEPNNPLAAYEALDATLQMRGDPRERVVVWRRIVGACPDAVRAQASLAAALVQKGDCAEAVSILRKLLEHSPTANESRGLLVTALTETRQYDAACEEVAACRNRGIRLPPEIIEALEQKSGRKIPPP